MHENQKASRANVQKSNTLFMRHWVQLGSRAFGGWKKVKWCVLARQGRRHSTVKYLTSLKGQLAARLQREAAGRMLSHHSPFRSHQNGGWWQRNVVCGPPPTGPRRYQKWAAPTKYAALAIAPVAGGQIKVGKGNKKNKRRVWRLRVGRVSGLLK